MTVELNRLPEDMPFEQVKQRVEMKIEELDRDKNGDPPNADERLKIARELMGYFTADEIAEAAMVSYAKAQDKIKTWESIGEVHAGTTTETGAVLYGVTTESP